MTEHSEPDNPFTQPSSSDGSDPAGGGQAINQTWDRMRAADRTSDLDSSDADSSDAPGTDDPMGMPQQGSTYPEEGEEVAGDDPEIPGRPLGQANDRTQI